MAEPQNTFYEDRKRFWILTAVIVAVLLVLAVAGWLGRSAYRHFKEKREQAQAQAFLAKGDYRSALLSARLPRHGRARRAFPFTGGAGQIGRAHV